MSRIKRLIRPEARSLNWKVALPLAGLLLTCRASRPLGPACAPAESARLERESSRAIGDIIKKSIEAGTAKPL